MYPRDHFSFQGSKKVGQVEHFREPTPPSPPPPLPDVSTPALLSQVCRASLAEVSGYLNERMLHMEIEEELGFQFWCDYTNQSSQVPALSMDRVVMDLRRWRASWLLGITSCFFRQDIERDRILPTPTISEIFQVHLLLFLPPLSKDHFPWAFF